MTKKELGEWGIGELSVFDLKTKCLKLDKAVPLMKITTDSSGQVTMKCFPYLTNEQDKVEYARQRIAQMYVDFPGVFEELMGTIRIRYNEKIIENVYSWNKKVRAQLNKNDTFSLDIGVYLYLSRGLDLEINPSYFL